MDLWLDGWSALVLGGVQGLVLDCARALAEAGVRVVINGRDQARGRAAAERLGAGVIFAQSDVSAPDARIRSLAEAAATLGPIEILVNSAGGPPPGRFG